MLTDLEKHWLTKCRIDDKYCITVDNDAVFIVDLRTQECVFDFRHYGWEMVIDLLLFLGCNAEEA